MAAAVPLVLAVLMLALPGSVLGGHAAAPAHPAPRLAVAVAEAEPAPAPEVAEYVCPMHPNEVSDGPGTCPICGMDLVLRGSADAHEGHDHDHAAQGDDPHAHHRAMLSAAGSGASARSEHRFAIPDLTLVDMHGERTTLLEAVDCGKPVLLNFIFTTCTTICPVQTAVFAQVQRDLGPEADAVRMISISIDPEHDTPERLREYAERFGAGGQWQFLTGELGQIIAAQKAFDAYRGTKMSHEPFTFLRGAPGEPWIRLDGIASASDIVKAYRELAAN